MLLAAAIDAPTDLSPGQRAELKANIKWLVCHITRGRGLGLLGDIVVGVIGAWLGGFILNVFGLYSVGFIGSLVTALIGAIVLLTLIRVIKNA